MRLLIFLQLTIALMAPAGAWAQHSEHHAEKQIQLDQGKKWKTDGPLRQGMDEIRKLIADQYSEINKNKASSSTYLDLASKIESQIQLIFKNCKLSPKADAQLHILIVQMLDGVNRIKASNEPSKQRADLFKIVEAVNRYGDYFDHPNWTKIQAM